MRIAFLTQPWATAVPPSESVAIWTFEVARRLAEDHEVAVWSRGTAEPMTLEGVEYRFASGRGDHRLERALRRVERLRPVDRPVFSSGLYGASYHLMLARDLRRWRPDVIQVQTFSQLVPLLRHSCPGASIVLHVRDEMLSRLSPRVLSRRLRDADVVLGVSEFISSGIRAAFPAVAARVRTIHNGVDVSRFAPAERAAAGPLRLLFVGRISPEKGVQVLLDAFARLQYEGLEAELTLVGDPLGSLPPEMLALFGVVAYDSSLETPPEVRMLGKRPYDDLPDLYRSAEVLVAPSLAEAFGLPLVEAMASGLPVVATRVGGIPEVVEDGVTGLLVAPGNRDALAAAIQRLRDPDLRRRLGRAGRERAESTFSYDRVTTELAALYDKLRSRSQ
jgi:glycosyltransferase involved in cell wall biosynthesis